MGLAVRLCSTRRAELRSTDQNMSTSSIPTIKRFARLRLTLLALGQSQLWPDWLGLKGVLTERVTQLDLTPRWGWRWTQEVLSFMSRTRRTVRFGGSQRAGQSRLWLDWLASGA